MTNGTTGTRERPVKTITTHEAGIKTATVEIKAMTVSNRQVTQALFKQLPEADLIDEEKLHFWGVPWGWVNYCPSKACDGRSSYWGSHVHVVWQNGEQLLRATIYEKGYRRTERYYRIVACLRACMEREGVKVGQGRGIERHLEPSEKVTGSLLALSQQALRDIDNAPYCDGGAGRHLASARMHAEAGHYELDAMCHGLFDFASAWQDRYEELLELEQLFIAV